MLDGEIAKVDYEAIKEVVLRKFGIGNWEAASATTITD
jgi:hypothetical protein